MISQLRSRYREGGLLGLIEAAVIRARGANYCVVYGTYRLDFLRMPVATEDPHGLSMTRIDTTTGLGDLVDIQDKPDRFRERLARGDTAFLAFIGNEPAGYMWTCTSPDVFEESYEYRIRGPGDGPLWPRLLHRP